jgi:transposase-like protein
VEFLQGLCKQGLDALPEALTLLLNAAMQAEREKYLGAAPYERTPDRRDYANGYKEKTLSSRVGELHLSIPQVRHGDFYPSSLEKGLRSERALKLSIAEMYVQGVSTRRVSSLVEKLCGTQISSSSVSRVAAELDEVLTSWRERPLGCFPYVYLDARYENVRRNGRVEEAAVLIAIGVDENGRRQVIGVSVSISEHEVHWREFLQSLLARGLTGVRLIISDDHAGLKAARRAVFGGVPWQRCQFHLQQNARAYVTKPQMQSAVAEDIRAIFAARDRDEADRLLKQTADKYEQTMPKLATWMQAALPEGLNVFSFPEPHRRLLRTTNGVERVNREIKRRTRVAGLFPNEASCLRLVSALLMEISEDWQTGKRYLSFDAT